MRDRIPRGRVEKYPIVLVECVWEPRDDETGLTVGDIIHPLGVIRVGSPLAPLEKGVGT